MRNVAERRWDNNMNMLCPCGMWMRSNIIDKRKVWKCRDGHRWRIVRLPQRHRPIRRLARGIRWQLP